VALAEPPFAKQQATQPSYFPVKNGTLSHCDPLTGAVVP
jgi:hypothetical protein